MKYEKLNIDRGNKKFLYGLIVGVLLIIIINSIFSYVKYKSIDSVKLASGTISYESADLNIIAMFKKDDEESDYQPVDEIPSPGYIIDNKSYCEEPNNEDKIYGLNYEKGILSLKYSKKGTKCYIYFKLSIPYRTLTKLNQDSQGSAKSFKGTACSTTCDIKDENGIFEATDDYGTSYYFRGSVNNNWVKFGQTTGGKDILWRIIRINGNGSIRLIYAGEPGSLGNGNGKNAVNSLRYNPSSSDNKYFGFMYGSAQTPTQNYEEAHKNEVKSDILTELEKWWDTTNLNSLLGKIDGAIGFCNDRQPYDGATASSKVDIQSHGYGKIATTYGPRIREIVTKQPTFKCAQKSQDLFTLTNESGEGNGKLEKPVGLITIDEAMYAGGHSFGAGTNNWLYTGEYYWTMSPVSLGYNYVIPVIGYSNIINMDHTTPGVRPVINLKEEISISYKTAETAGTIDNPYVILSYGQF